MIRFDPKTKQYPFPENTDGHYLKVKMDRGIIFDEKYPYVDKTKSFAFKQFWVHLLLRILVFPMVLVRNHIKIKGKANLKRYKAQLSHGAISIANHINMWDYICVMKALHNFKWPYLLAWDKNINGENGTLIRLVGGIPIPVNNNAGTIEFSRQLKELLSKGNILHIYPEGSMWEYYAPIRPFKSGASSLALHNNIPILPMGFSFRKPLWYRRVLFKRKAELTLTIGEPIFANPDLEKGAQLEDLTRRAHEAVCALAGFEGDNIYEPIFNDSKKINYY